MIFLPSYCYLQFYESADDSLVTQAYCDQATRMNFRRLCALLK